MLNTLNIEVPAYANVTSIKYRDSIDEASYEIGIEELSAKVKQDFTYSNAIFFKEKNHAPFYSKKERTSHISKAFNRFEEVGFTDASSFVICNMGKVGHGLFADRDFEPLECFILYSGLMYGGDVDTPKNCYCIELQSGLSLGIDASRIGNIARFIQHMPMNFQESVEYHRSIESRSDKQLLEDLHFDKFSINYWYWRNFTSNEISEGDLAWANLDRMTIPINDTPCVVLYNTKKVKKGEQLGFSYGYFYWFLRGVRAELFDLRGEVIPAEKYGFKEVLLQLPFQRCMAGFSPLLSELAFQRSYSASMFLRDLERDTEYNHPTWFGVFNEPVSIFKLREWLLEYRVISKQLFGSIEDDSYVLKLRELLPTGWFTVKMYERLPHNSRKRGVFDIVCYTNELKQWSCFTHLLKCFNPFVNAKIPNCCLKLTQEIIFTDIKGKENKFGNLIECLMICNSLNLFHKKYPEPSGPKHNDPTTIVEASSEDSLSQILFHNPHLTRDEIQDTYLRMNRFLVSGIMVNDLIPKLSETSYLHDDSTNPFVLQMITQKEIALHDFTCTFFKSNTPKRWNTYPKQRLTGKYVGHHVRFLNLNACDSEIAKTLTSELKSFGFHVILSKVIDKPSIIVDLSTSMKVWL